MTVQLEQFYRGKTVLVTGQTGFKGSWLSFWLHRLGANVVGLGLEEDASHSPFEALGLRCAIENHFADICDLAKVRDIVNNCRPSIVLHLAAQPIVRDSYDRPVETFATNVMGAVHILDVLRNVTHPCAAVVVTSDKCYENREFEHAYRENDPVGGHDPYSCSKGCTELVAASYRRSFFSGKDSNIRVCSARAGNVIGGGDWAAHRIVPDCARALSLGKTIEVRNPYATRPWQHVLEPLSGYLWLAQRLFAAMETDDNLKIDRFASAFNFGPAVDSNQTVGRLVPEILKTWPGEWQVTGDQNARHEATLLALAIDRAVHTLNWLPVWSFDETVRQTIEWYRFSTTQSDFDAVAFTSRQIDDYTSAAASKNVSWALP